MNHEVIGGMTNMNNPVFFNVVDTALLNAKLGEDEISTPVISILIEKPTDDEKKKIKFSDDISDNAIVQYYIKDISLFDDSSPVINITARVATEYFEDDQPGELSDSFAFQDVEMLIPLPYLSLAFALKEDLLMAVKVDDGERYTTYDQAPQDFFTNTDIILAFPPDGSESYDNIAEKFGSLLAEPFNAPLDIVRSGAEAGIPNDAIIAQYLLFSIFNEMSDGKESGLNKLIQLAVIIDKNEEEKEEDQTIKEIDSPWAAYAALIATEAYRSSKIEVDGINEMIVPQVEMMGEDESSVEEDMQLNEEFAEIINESKLFDILENLPNFEPAQSYPLEDGKLPGKMSELQQFFDEGGRAHNLARLLSKEEGVTTNSSHQLIEDHSLGNYVAAIIIITIARAINLVEKDDYQHVSHVAAGWLYLHGDKALWVLPALSVQVASYETKVFEELLEFKREDGSMVFLPEVLHALGDLVAEEEWDHENVETRFQVMDIELPALPQVKELLHRTVSSQDKDNSDIPSKIECFGCRNVFANANLIMNDEAPIDDAIKNVSWTIPALADVAAANLDLDIGSDNWKQHKAKYVFALMKMISDHADED